MLWAADQIEHERQQALGAAASAGAAQAAAAADTNFLVVNLRGSKPELVTKKMPYSGSVARLSVASGVDIFPLLAQWAAAASHSGVDDGRPTGDKRARKG